ncbi:MAG: M23 family metallopeptidase [Pseudomonadota bacterium]
MAERRHAPIGRSRALVRSERGRPLPQVYLGRTRRPLPDVYHGDHGGRSEGRFKWLLSTCLAAGVGSIAIITVILGSMDKRPQFDGALPDLSIFADAVQPMPRPQASGAGLNWASPKVDRLPIGVNVVSVRQTIHDSMRIRQGARELIRTKPYARLIANLAAVAPETKRPIPAFNPFRLYAASRKAPTADSRRNANVSIQVVELHGGILPVHDGQELDSREVTSLVRKAITPEEAPSLIRAGYQPAGSDLLRLTPDQTALRRAQEPVPPNTTVLRKSSDDLGDDDDAQREQRAFVVERGQRLFDLVVAAGGAQWQAHQMTAAAAKPLRKKKLRRGDQVIFTLEPSLADPTKLEPTAFSVYGAGQVHKVTVSRDPSGAFVASETPINAALMRRLTQPKITASNLYKSIFSAARTQELDDAQVFRILRMHAYDTDFRQRTAPGDSLDLFFDLKRNGDANTALNTLLSAAITHRGKTKRFYRFRRANGSVDFFDKRGHNAKRFLNLRPVRSNRVRRTSGFGMRLHPVLGIRRMHSGVDWAAPTGTPIIAAGNGYIEEMGWKSGAGNYMRLRHSNGYKTSYSHMSKFARGLRKGMSVRIGQLIGYVGSTGLSTGPHLHFEVLVNNRPVDPRRVRVPREVRLRGRDLAAFQKERQRIDELMQRTPVKTTHR